MSAELFRKKPIVIEAMLYPGMRELHDAIPVIEWLDSHGVDHRHDRGLVIRTLEGDMRADPGDWIIKGVKGEFYPCKPDIFEATYESAEQAAADRSSEATSPTEAQSNRGGSSERVREDREGRDNRDDGDDGDQRSDTDTDTGADDRDDLGDDRAHRGEHHHREEVVRRRDVQAGAGDPVQPSRGAEASG